MIIRTSHKSQAQVVSIFYTQVEMQGDNQKKLFFIKNWISNIVLFFSFRQLSKINEIQPYVCLAFTVKMEQTWA